MVGRAKVTFRYNEPGVAAVLASPAMRELLERLTAEVAVTARRLAPRLLGFVIESIEGEVARAGAGERDAGGRFTGFTGGYVGRVTAKDFKASWHEFGTRKMHAHPFLFPALAQALPGAPITRGRSRG